MTMTSPAWDPQQYNRFERQRDRAAIDLLSQLPDDLDPHEIWDIGCGTGQHAALLKRRWPDARVHGLDSSAAMLEQARGLPDDVDWVQGDLEAWKPAAPVDLILANASLQWAPDHAELFRRLTEALAPDGVLAVQMPMAWETRHHTLMRQTAADGPWSARLKGVDTIPAAAGGRGLLRRGGGPVRGGRRLVDDLSPRLGRRERRAGVGEGHRPQALSDRALRRPSQPRRLSGAPGSGVG